jgi:hypothetical protein
MKELLGFLYGLGALIILSFIGFLFYDRFPNNIGIIGAILIALIGLIVGVFVFRMFSSRGVMEMWSGDSASSDMDRIYHQSGSNVKKYLPEELVEVYHKERYFLRKSGKIRIWGDWKKRGLDENNVLLSIEYSKNTDKLLFRFKRMRSLTIYGASEIYAVDTYIKVQQAKTIEWKTNLGWCKYENLNDKIEFETNMDWAVSPFDLGTGFDAIFFSG